MARRNNIWANLDWLTVILYLILVFLGWINIYAAVFNEEHASILDMSQRYGKQLIWIGAAIVIAIMLLIIDSKFYVFFAYVFYGITILLLVAVLLFGTKVKGATSWFQIGGFAIQPAEFVKFTTALALAKYMSTHSFKMEKISSLLIIGAILALPVALIFLQNDTGSALVISVFILVLFREGLSGVVLFLAFVAALIFILTLVLSPFHAIIILSIGALLFHYFIRQQLPETLKALGIYTSLSAAFLFGGSIFKLEIAPVQLLLSSTIISVIIFGVYSLRHRLYNMLTILGIYLGLVFFTFSVDYVFNNILEPHHQARINEVLGIESDPLGIGYNVNQSKIAIGSGGFSGKGFLNGTQTKFDFVPEQSTDFIFCTVGEEWGFIGTTSVLILFLTLLLRLIYLAERQRSTFSRVYGYSVACILFFHLAINIGMTIGLAPVIGIPLPFFSYGGSSLWSFTILLFIFLRLDASRSEKLSH
ncbi:rod shape-determining protein RodA [Sunxiuqinia elliptica]|uniref:Cell wall polymerase n=1 Tax=Sunxiuqinia elliptica TaxID=655355 RepID=A0A4R6H8W2_9BACT|nr:rod shape-determining protein RodA [Sunxiuqinia elliptica]TDO04710.1 rod shape determining protein RodA [Sunxiuqinia elliptica]TDO64258.1 rod shape determining protein RodA [Sunxiuqinia elliptica]